MSKLEKFFKTGNPRLVIDHLRRVKNMRAVMHALDHEDWNVIEAAHSAWLRLYDWRKRAPVADLLKLLRSEIPHSSAQSVARQMLSESRAEDLAPHAEQIIMMARSQDFYTEREKIYAAVEKLGEKAIPQLSWDLANTHVPNELTAQLTKETLQKILDKLPPERREEIQKEYGEDIIAKLKLRGIKLTV
ncbi:MAG TPA: hypothetical protein VGQ00_04860 [Candidatus Norongarragalinales archaeon]|jgi:DNA-directed RNA polymerase specialized sigma24 family protein|nr:hypothetical protein [Candidatus Norongarragalinales archaeon]